MNFWKRNGKKVQGHAEQETGLMNKGRLKVLKDTKFVLNDRE
jgi:hypothetical protein